MAYVHYNTMRCGNRTLVNGLDTSFGLMKKQFRQVRIMEAKITEKKKYTEYELNKRMRFKKNRYDANSLVQELPKAIENEKNYCEDLNLLENTVGSNLGKLFDKIIIKEVDSNPRYLE